jgi:hypothetical protein
VNHDDTIRLPRKDAAALAGLLRMLEALLEIADPAIADALDDHFGFPGSVEFLLATAGLHADHLHTLLTGPHQSTDSTKIETTP